MTIIWGNDLKTCGIGIVLPDKADAENTRQIIKKLIKIPAIKIIKALFHRSFRRAGS